MPKLFRTLGPVPVPTQVEDIANKGYVDNLIQNIPPDVLTYFRLSDVQVLGGTYATYADIGLGNIASGGGQNRFSRVPFPLRITRFGLNYQSTSIAGYSGRFNQPYFERLFRYNPQGSTPPAVELGNVQMSGGSAYADTGPINLILGVTDNDVYQWTGASSGTIADIGSVNFTQWFEFVPISPSELESEKFQLELEAQEKRIMQNYETYKNKQWYKDLIKDFKTSQKDTKNNATK